MKNIFYASLLVFSLNSCDKGECDGAVTGTVRNYTGLDGCGYVIELSNGDKLEPINLSEFSEFAVDNKRVRLTYEEVGAASVCMVGKMVNIKCIESR